MKLENFFDLLIYKTRANLRAEVSRLYLNYAWWALEPLFAMGVFYIVFGIFMNSQTPHFALFLLIGTTQWQWFASTTMNASASILGASHLMQQISIPKIFFPLEVFLQDFFKHLFVLGLLALFIIFYPIPFSVSWFSLPVIIFIHGFLILTCAILFSSLVPFFPDLRLILSTVLNVMFFITGIFFDANIFVLPEHRHWIFINPMAGIIREYRQVIIHGVWPDWAYLFNVFFSVSLLLVLSLFIIFKNDKLYPRICQQ